MKKFKSALLDFFLAPPPELKKAFEKQEMYTNSDTSRIDEHLLFNNQDEEKLKEEELQNDKNYWWNYEGAPYAETPVFEEIDNQKVTEELCLKIERGEFPVIEIPSNVMRTMQILNNQEFDYAEVASLINHSPGMAGEFIRVINSSVYSRGVVINDIKLALPRLGRENIKALLYMYSAKISFLNDPLFNQVAVDIVEHSYSVGIIAAYLSQRYYPDPDGAFLAGLLHDIGKLGILKALSQLYDLPKHVDFKVTEEVFDNIFPGLHEKAGKYLANHWKVNEDIVSAIEHHHDFMNIGFSEDDQLAFHLSCIVNLSDNMARILGSGRRIGPVNIFSLPSTIDLSIEKTEDTICFLDDIPKIIAYKQGEMKGAPGNKTSPKTSAPQKKI